MPVAARVEQSLWYAASSQTHVFNFKWWIELKAAVKTFWFEIRETS
jgi:hypothetical protein